MTREDIKNAKDFLERNGFRDLDPATFLIASRELDVGFHQMLQMIGQMLMQGQGLGVAPQTVRAFGRKQY